MGGFISPIRTHLCLKLKSFIILKNNGMITSRRFKTNFNKKILSEFCSCTLLPSVSTHFCEKAFISHGINQNQAQELPATGDELHTRCQYRATQNREATVMKTS